MKRPDLQWGGQLVSEWQARMPKISRGLCVCEPEEPLTLINCSLQMITFPKIWKAPKSFEGFEKVCGPNFWHFSCYLLAYKNDNKHIPALKAPVWHVIFTPIWHLEQVLSLADLEPSTRRRNAFRCWKSSKQLLPASKPFRANATCTYKWRLFEV